MSRRSINNTTRVSLLAFIITFVIFFIMIMHNVLDQSMSSYLKDSMAVTFEDTVVQNQNPFEEGEAKGGEGGGGYNDDGGDDDDSVAENNVDDENDNDDDGGSFVDNDKNKKNDNAANSKITNGTKESANANSINNTTIVTTAGEHQQQNQQENEQKEGDGEQQRENNNEDDQPPPPPNPHPHAGAKDSNNQWGYVPDITLLRQHHLETYGATKVYPISAFNVSEYLDYACGRNITTGWEGKAGFDLMQKVQIDKTQLQYDNGEDQHSTTALSTRSSRPPKVLCAIYTYDKNHPRLEAISRIWGWKCDGFFAASTLTDPSIGAINLPHHGDEAYDNMWQKTRSIWAFIYDNYMNDYDYFWLGGDDYYLIVENLVKFLGTINRSDNEARLIAHQIPHRWGIFCGGGAGYVLNRMAVKRFVEEALPTCYVRLSLIFASAISIIYLFVY